MFTWPYYVAWEKLSWEAFATLTAGALAVAGATVIGLRQLKIAERQAEMAARQAEIAHRQALLADLEVRVQLFERRLRVYKATEAFLVGILRDLKAPTDEVKWQFLAAKAEAPLLFRREVKNRLDGVWNEAGEAISTREMIGRYERTDSETIRANTAAFSALNQTLQNLPDLFGDEIRLSIHDEFEIR